MELTTLELDGFRNYTHARLSLDGGCNVIYGENAQGKTNLLEAVAYLAALKSSRARSDKELIAFDAAEAVVKGEVQARDRTFQLEARIPRGRAKRFTLNGVAQRGGAAAAGALHTVYFCPEDLFLIREGAAARRRFLDTALCQLRPRYVEALGKYRRVYENKTRILRDSEEHPDYLSALPEFNEQLTVYGAVLIHYRARFCESLQTYAAAAHGECSGGREALALRYETVKTVTDPFAAQDVLRGQLWEHLEQHSRAEHAARLCLSGPHKDDIEVLIDGMSAKAYSSQGQTRTAALSMKLAEREIYKNTIGEYPVLLLDDVLSELDPRRQEFVLNRIGGGQVLITCCEDDRLSRLLQGKTFHIQSGAVI